MPAITLTDRQLCDLELILNGGFSPLEGMVISFRVHFGLQLSLGYVLYASVSKRSNSFHVFTFLFLKLRMDSEIKMTRR